MKSLIATALGAVFFCAGPAEPGGLSIPCRPVVAAFSDIRAAGLAPIARARGDDGRMIVVFATEDGGRVLFAILDPARAAVCGFTGGGFGLVDWKPPKKEAAL